MRFKCKGVQLSVFPVVSQEHDCQKAEKLTEIYSQYVSGDEMGSSNHDLISFKQLLNGECDLVDQLETFAKRIHELQSELRIQRLTRKECLTCKQ